MDDKYDVVELAVERTVGIKVTFADNYFAEIDLMTLRLICPCAMCRSLRERGKAAWPQSEGSQKLSALGCRFLVYGLGLAGIIFENGSCKQWFGMYLART